MSVLRAGSLRSVALVFATAACVGPPEATGDGERAKLVAYVLERPPPAVGRRLDVDFDGKVTLLGARIEPSASVKPGQRVKLTMYWQVKTPPGDGWGLFTHVLDGAGERVLNADNVGPLRRLVRDRQVLGPWAWQAGKVYVDEQEITIPANVRGAQVQLVTGLWKGDQRLPIRSGARDGEQRAVVATLDTGTGAARHPTSTRVPRLTVPALSQGRKITIDGRLDEAAWAQAANSGPFRDVATGEANTRRDLAGTARIVHDANALYIGFEVTDINVVGGFDRQQVDPPLWTRDTVEIMIDPDGDGDNRDYYEIQINPQALVFDSRFDDYNRPRTEPNGPFGHQQWSAKVEAAVVVDGTLDDAKDQDRGYTVEAKIPWRSFDRAKRRPPAPGDEWRVNLYAMQDNGGVAWSPILRQGNFHKASRFGRFTFADPAAPAASAGAPPRASSR